jgi:hypothetical protein
MREIDGIDPPIVVQIGEEDEQRVVSVIGPSSLFRQPVPSALTRYTPAQISLKRSV